MYKQSLFHQNKQSLVLAKARAKQSLFHRNRTWQPKAKDIVRGRHFIDAKGKVLGRLATGVATLLMGKNKAMYAPYIDCGDWVYVVNAKDIEVTGRKKKQKVYPRHSGYPGGLKIISFAKLKQDNPSRIIEQAVYNMLPANRLRSGRMRRLRVFDAEES